MDDQFARIEKHKALVKRISGELTVRDAVFSGVSGAVMRSIPVGGAQLAFVKCYTTTRCKRRNDSIHWRYTKTALKFDLIENVRVAKTNRVLLDLCMETDAVSCLIALNHCLHLKMTTPEKIMETIGKYSKVPGKKRILALL